MKIEVIEERRGVRIVAIDKAGKERFGYEIYLSRPAMNLGNEWEKAKISWKSLGMQHLKSGENYAQLLLKAVEVGKEMDSKLDAFLGEQERSGKNIHSFEIGDRWENYLRGQISVPDL
jgi:hypothetical protein